MAESTVTMTDGATGADAPEGEAAASSSGLPENFDSVEALVKSYKESQAELTRLKQGKTEQDNPDDETTEEGTEETGEEEDQTNQDPPAQQLPENLQPFSEEFAEKGTLTEESYGKLAELGYSKEVVDAYIKGVQGDPLGEADVKSIVDTIGGQENFQALQTWAGENLEDSELEAYNAAIQSKASAKMAVEWLQMKQQAAEGFEPTTKVEGTPRATSGVKPFQSAAELSRAMQDPRYKQGDKEYHAEIDKRLAISKAF